MEPSKWLNYREENSILLNIQLRNMFIDTHTHLYGKQFENDRAAVLQRAIDAGVGRFYLPAIDSLAMDDLLALEAACPDVCIAMPGLHPCSVAATYQQELEYVAQWLSKRKFPAIGEIGLDLYWDKTFAAQQTEAFRFQIELALHYKLPIVIHTRNAMPETMAIVKEYIGRGLYGIFHCFGGSVAEAKAIVEMGFYLGIGGVVTYKHSGLAEVLPHIPLQHIVLETDAPYLTPIPFRGKRNESSYLIYVAQKLAEIYNVSLNEIEDQTTRNAQAVFAY